MSDYQSLVSKSHEFQFGYKAQIQTLRSRPIPHRPLASLPHSLPLPPANLTSCFPPRFAGCPVIGGAPHHPHFRFSKGFPRYRPLCRHSNRRKPFGSLVLRQTIWSKNACANIGTHGYRNVATLLIPILCHRDGKWAAFCGMSCLSRATLPIARTLPDDDSLCLAKATLAERRTVTDPFDPDHTSSGGTIRTKRDVYPVSRSLRRMAFLPHSHQRTQRRATSPCWATRTWLAEARLECHLRKFDFQGFGSRAVTVRFDVRAIASDADSLLLGELEAADCCHQSFMRIVANHMSLPVPSHLVYNRLQDFLLLKHFIFELEK